MTGSDDGVRVDTTLSLLTPYAAYLAAEKLGVSGVLAVVAAGLCAGVLDRGQQRATTRLHGRALWSTVAPTLSGAVFVMLGLEMRQVLHRVEGHGAWTLVGYVIGLALTLFAVRMAWTMFSAGIAQRTPTVAAETLPGFGTQLVAVLCGVRGSLALTAALSIPLVTAASTAMPGRDLVVFLTAGTIAVTLLLSGVTLPFLKPGPLIENTVSGCAWQARVATTRVALQVIESDPVVAVSPRLRGAAMALKRLYASRLAALESADAETIELHRSDFAAHRRLSMNVLSAQRRELARLRSEGALTEAAMHEIELDLNLAEIVVDRLEWRGAAAA
jgi:CPA1 family monovalent cation:H+ antiporter